MPTSTREILLSRYHYDPLDRLVNSTPFEQPTQRYYCKTRLATEIHSGVQRTIVQHDDQLLAQQQSELGKRTATLLATDQQRSVLSAIDANQPNPIAYSPYGHRPLENGLLSLLGFNGERPDPVTGHYHLGNGYRQFNPVLMRFNSPDSWSPFGEGGLNAYGYCDGDSVNRYDPSGHVGVWKGIQNKLGRTRSRESLTKSFNKAKSVVSEAMDFNQELIQRIPKIDGSANRGYVQQLVDSGDFGPSHLRETRFEANRQALENKSKFIKISHDALTDKQQKLQAIYDNLNTEQTRLKNLKRTDKKSYFTEKKESLEKINTIIRHEKSKLIEQKQIPDEGHFGNFR